ncbi:MAG: T9SS type A sorting domain-containing protein [Ignavibacteriales bacterium]|nr:T9SS type A sorting domain-containing protein [Ignavibacteriales bacterium]
MGQHVVGNVPDGTNQFELIPPTRGINETIGVTTGRLAGRDLIIVPGPNSLDGDDLADIVVTDYARGGTIHVFEQVNPSSLQFQLVYSSDSLMDTGMSLRPYSSADAAPRTLAIGDMDRNGTSEIIFPAGRMPSDTGRGIYFYEWDGAKDNVYRIVFRLRPEEIDTLFAASDFGRQEGSGLIADDVDNDGKFELLVGSRDFGGPASRFMYVLQVMSGTFAEGDAIVAVEYKYEDFQFVDDDGILPDKIDGFIPFGMEVGDFDGDGLKEIMLLGWRDIGTGSALGFIDIPAADTYVEGSVFAPVEGNVNQFNVSPNPTTVPVPSGVNVPYIFLEPISGERTLIALEGITDVSNIGRDNVRRIWTGVGSWGGLSWGDQDHGIEGDGFEIYIPHGKNVASLEYRGSGSPFDSTSFVLNDSLFSLEQVFLSPDGAITDVVTFVGMDLDKNGKREVVINYKPGPNEIVRSTGQPHETGTYVFFILEWGDASTAVVSVQSPSSIPSGYRLHQNHPNPFNASTHIEFSVAEAGPVHLEILDALGRSIRVLLTGTLKSGGYRIGWDATDEHGMRVASGVYFYRLSAGSFVASRRMVLVK